MALGSTQAPTSMNTRICHWGYRRPVRRAIQGFLYLCLPALIRYVIKVDIIRIIVCFEACSNFREASSVPPQLSRMRAGARVRTEVNESGKIDAVERGPSVSLYIA
jgi:hypothetical protein